MMGNLICGNVIFLILLFLFVLPSAGTQQTDTKRQNLLERLLDAVKQVSYRLSGRSLCWRREIIISAAVHID